MNDSQSFLYLIVIFDKVILPNIVYSKVKLWRFILLVFYKMFLSLRLGSECQNLNKHTGKQVRAATTWDKLDSVRKRGWDGIG